MSPSWWPFGKKDKLSMPEPEYFSVNEIFKLVKRLATKDLHYPSLYSGLHIQQRIDSGESIQRAEDVEFVSKHIVSMSDDPLKLLFLIDCPDWNNPYPALEDFNSHLRWLFENIQAQDTAFQEWRQQFLIK
jgi:hypothetical protein